MSIRTDPDAPSDVTISLFDNYQSGDDPRPILEHVRSEKDAAAYLDRLRELYLSYHTDEENADLFCASVVAGHEVKEEADWYVDSEEWPAFAEKAGPLVMFVRYLMGYEIEL